MPSREEKNRIVREEQTRSVAAEKEETESNENVSLLEGLFELYPSYRSVLVGMCGFDASSKDCFRILGTDRGAIYWQVHPKADVADLHGLMHGGFVTYLCDSLTTLHLALEVGHTRHVTVNFNTTILYPVPVEAPLAVRTYINKVGKRLVFMEADIFARDKPGKVLASCMHTKAFVRHTRFHRDGDDDLSIDLDNDNDQEKSEKEKLSSKL